MGGVGAAAQRRKHRPCTAELLGEQSHVHAGAAEGFGRVGCTVSTYSNTELGVCAHLMDKRGSADRAWCAVPAHQRWWRNNSPLIVAAHGAWISTAVQLGVNHHNQACAWRA